MRDVFLVSYDVKGIKTLDRMVSLLFYKKTIVLQKDTSIPKDTQRYNMKGIYGMNGSGKSGIIASVDILSNLIVDEDYLNNPMVQDNLSAMINKTTEELYLGVKFLAGSKQNLYFYEIILKKNKTGKYYIATERLTYKHATTKKEEFDPVVEVNEGAVIQLNAYDKADSAAKLKEVFSEKTKNLLSNSTISALFANKVIGSDGIETKHVENILGMSLAGLFILGSRIHVYMDQSDNHANYFLANKLQYFVDSNDEDMVSWLLNASEMHKNQLDAFSIGTKRIRKQFFEDYEKSVERLQDFIQIFKSDLTEIAIEKKEDGEFYVCSLNLGYGNYYVNAEFESTGIKKLIKLFAYLQEMVNGGIVFIDELDSNLHDVYLCALLEYLMDYGRGQMCFTTHNVGPMDILKRNKKSIDFLSMDHQIYPWKTNGNYSPSKLYKNGMIIGSPFNVDAFDFIGVFDSLREE